MKKKSVYEINYLTWMTGLPKWLAKRIVGMEFKPDGKFKVRLILKVNTKGWRAVYGRSKDRCHITKGG